MPSLWWVPLRCFLLLLPFFVRAPAEPALDFDLEAGLFAPPVVSIFFLGVVLAAMRLPSLVGLSFSSIPLLGVFSLWTDGSGGIRPLLRNPTFLQASADRVLLLRSGILAFLRWRLDSPLGCDEGFCSAAFACVHFSETEWLEFAVEVPVAANELCRVVVGSYPAVLMSVLDTVEVLERRPALRCCSPAFLPLLYRLSDDGSFAAHFVESFFLVVESRPGFN